jgi:S1-C subfamily serine protease
MPGSIITQVDNNEIKSLEDLLAIADKIRVGKKSIPFLLVDPRGSIEYKAVRP